MHLPKMRLEVKLLFFFISISLAPLLISNFLWFRAPLTTTTALIFFLLTFVIEILISIWLANRLVDPILQIYKAFKEVGQGNLEHRVTIHTGDELEDLANSFNAMRENLKKSIATLRHDREVISAERNKFAVLLSGITDAIIAVDLKHNIVTCNNAAQKLIGTSEAEVLGKPVMEVFKVFDENGEIAPSVYCPLRTDDFEGVVFSKKNLKLVGLNGKIVYVDIITGKIKEAASIDLGCIVTLHDISEEKKLEDMKLDFVSMAAHELRTPLTSLKGYLSVFRQENKDRFNDDQLMFLNRIDISASQLSSLVENLLSVSRIERGAFNVITEAVDWALTASKIIDELKDRAKDKKITLEYVEPSESIPMVAADKIRISEVLTNLLANAITYTQPGGKVTVSIEQKDKEVITRVADTGQGIPQEALPQLFTKFFRVSGPLESGSKGTGLGLYISKAIIDMHRGRIWVESQLGKGSTFSFSLPIAYGQEPSMGEQIHYTVN